MFDLLKKIFFVIFILAAAYIPGRSILPGYITGSLPASYMNSWLDGLSAFVDGEIEKHNLSRKVQVVTAGQFMAKFKESQNDKKKKNKVRIIFVYCLKDQLCKQNFKDVMSIGNGFRSELIEIFAVAIENDEQNLSRFINEQEKIHDQSLSFVPYMVKNEERGKLLAALYGAGALDYRTPPYVTVVSPSGSFQSVKLDYYAEKKIRERIAPYMKIEK